jgi:hypothetical protein
MAAKAAQGKEGCNDILSLQKIMSKKWFSIAGLVV